MLALMLQLLKVCITVSQQLVKLLIVWAALLVADIKLGLFRPIFCAIIRCPSAVTLGLIIEYL